MIFDIAYWTGERLGAIVQLRVEHAYTLDKWPRDSITFPASTRKARPNGERETREVYVHSNLRSLLCEYQQPFYGYLFPGLEDGSHLSFDAADDALRRAVDKARLNHVGISTHSFRRSFANAIANNGASLQELMSVMGWRDPKVAIGYLETNPERLKQVVMSR